MTSVCCQWTPSDNGRLVFEGVALDALAVNESRLFLKRAETDYMALTMPMLGVVGQR